MGRVKRIWYLSSTREAKVQASLRIRAVSPEPPLLTHTSSESRGTFSPKARSLAPLNGWACAVKICHDGMLEDTNSLDGAHLIFIKICLFFPTWWNALALACFDDSASIVDKLRNCPEETTLQLANTVKLLKIWPHEKNYCNYPKILLIWIFYRVMRPKDADGMSNSVDPDQPALSLIWVYTACSDMSLRKFRNITVQFLKFLFMTSIVIRRGLGSRADGAVWSGSTVFAIPTVFEPPHDKTNKVACSPTED